MSRIEKLKSLLARVEQRRAEPRLVAVSGGHALSSANTNLATPSQSSLRSRETPLELAPRPPSVTPATPAVPPPAPTPIEEAFAPSAPSSIPPPSIHEAETKLRSSLPPPTRATPSSTAPSSTVPPSALPPPQAASLERPAARSTTEVLPAAPSRIAPSPPLPFDSAVRVTSSPRLDVPKTFGELLEQSLALRPKSG